MTTTLQQCPDFSAAVKKLRDLHADVSRHLANRQAEHGVIIDIQSVRCQVARTHCLLEQLDAALASTAAENTAQSEGSDANHLRSVTALAWRLYFELMFLGGAHYFEHGTAADAAWSALNFLREKVATS